MPTNCQALDRILKLWVPRWQQRCICVYMCMGLWEWVWDGFWLSLKFVIDLNLRGGTSTPWQWSAQSRRKERVSLCLQLFEESWNWSEPNSYAKESCFSKAGGDDNWREHAKVSNKKGDFVLNLALFFNCQCEKKTKKTAANYDNRSVVLLRLKRRMHRQIQFSCQLDCVCPC